MNLFKTDNVITLNPVECLEGGGWRGPRPLKTRGGLIMTGYTDEEHDMMVDFCQGYDPNGLRGIVVSLHVENPTDDPPQINLLTLPAAGQIIRHQDKYYLVKVVVQSTNGSAAIFVDRLPLNTFGHYALRLRK